VRPVELIEGGAKLFDGHEVSAEIFKQSMGLGNRVGIGLSYWAARLAELIPWIQFLGFLKV
jgi:hypothetical protein